MLDGLLRRIFTSFSTLFLVAFMVTGPLHLAYAVAFRNVIATADLHDEIREFPNYRQVHGVGPPTLTRAAVVFWGITAIEILLLPLAVRAARRVVSIEADGGVASAIGAWRHLWRPDDHQPAPASSAPEVGWGAILGCIAIAVVVGVLIEASARTVAELVTEDGRWIVIGMGQAVARAAAALFVLVPLGSAWAAKARPPAAPKLY